MVPAMVVVVYGEEGATHLPVFSQVVLSLQLPFAVSPLVRLTNSKARMGRYANKPLAAAVAGSLTALLVGLNALLLADFF